MDTKERKIECEMDGVSLRPGNWTVSFQFYARKVRNRELPMHSRLSALRSCALRCASLLRRKRSEILDPLVHTYHLDAPEGAAEQELLAALADIEGNRTVFLQGLRAFGRYRKNEKRAGKRQLSKNERRMLDDMSNEWH